MRQYTSRTIKRNLFVAMLLAPFVPVVLALGTGSFLYWQTVQDNLHARLRQTVDCSARQVETYLEGCIADLSLLEKSIAERPDFSNLRSALAALQSVHHDVIDMAAIDVDGSVLAYAGPLVLKGSHISPGKWFNEAVTHGLSIGEVQTGLMGIPHYLIARRIDTPTGSMILRIAVDPAGLDKVLQPTRDASGEVTLVNREGITIAGSDALSLTADPRLARPYFLDRVGTVFTDSDGSAVYASQQLRDVEWILALRTHVTSPFKNGAGISFYVGLTIVVGGIIVFLSSLYLAGYVEKMLSQRDSEKEKLRDQLYRAGRLAELGEMAAGFAHEINNPLQIMKSDQAYIEMVLQDCREHCAERPDLQEDIDEIQTSVTQIKLQIDRCARITHSILRFGRAENVEIQNLDLAKFIPEVVSMIRKKAQLDNIALRVDIGDDKLLVRADPGRLQQVLLNLLNNAMYAVKETHDARCGEIHISCGLEQLGRVYIRVADNGVGISPENQKIIFTPFFTTKPPGSGTGLGLSLCHGIVDSMNGVLDFVSEWGKGTTFSIVLPGVQSH